MRLKPRLFTKEFKLAAVWRLEQGVPVVTLARAPEVSPKALDRWRCLLLSGPKSPR